MNQSAQWNVIRRVLELGSFEMFPKFLGIQARVAMPSTNGYHALETTETETVETGETRRCHPHWQSNWRIERNDVIIEKDRESYWYPPYMTKHHPNAKSKHLEDEFLFGARHIFMHFCWLVSGSPGRVLLYPS